MAFSKARRLANLMSSASDTVPAAKVNTVLADDAVTSPKIADDAVTTDKLANSINTAISDNTAKVTNAITTHTGDVTGGAALTIANDAVDIPMLSASGTANSTTFLRGDNAWAAPGGVDIQSSVPSVASEGSLYYNTTTDKLFVSTGSAWVTLMNDPGNPTSTGGTITISPQFGAETFSYNLGLNFADSANTDGQLTYTLESGTLPAGCVLPTSGNSAFTGTVGNTSATYNFVIRATDTGGLYATQAYTQVITIFSGTGGTITTISGYKVHTFNSSGTFYLPGPVAVQYLVVGGGGGGAQGYQGGGGGAGGYRSNVTGQVSGGGTNAEVTMTLAAGNHTITIGAGGAGGPSVGSLTSSKAGDGGSSIMGSVKTSLGGGGGASYWNGVGNAGGRSGASGGGGGCTDGGGDAGGAGTGGQGYNGGSANGYSSPYSGGGGGGGAGLGANGAGQYGYGGLAPTSNIDGTTTYRSGGGGAGNWAGAYGATGGGLNKNASNNGGGGNGAAGAQSSQVATVGRVNTGGGGGAEGDTLTAGKAGGSGVVIIRYAQ